MNIEIEKLQQSIEPLRQQIINHKVYGVINNLQDLKIFMEHHIYAVWDFMSLLKSLQNNLTCTSVPWYPKGSADTRFLINEIVVGEESDVDEAGTRMSHFELYLNAMQQAGADITAMEKFIEILQHTADFDAAFAAAGTPNSASNFVKSTFKVINSNKAHLQSAIFTFGREDLIPGMFHSIVNDIYKNFPDNIAKFKYYLERHIEVDGGHHSHLALQMTANLCGNNEALWLEAEQATLASLQTRIELWDGVYEEIMQTKNMEPFIIEQAIGAAY